ncbi:unnamed protein product [Leptidea sinapis]|uniref:Myosin tail domain-containing protein n=1 Tax=Leptidea sinapis TaxID=189913 RepID=A0A5E4QC75_9NEOP|nr:unnamed protein product [Leptidea sinapis]
MPAVKVFNIFGGQKPAEKQSPATGIQKFYRTFSVGAEKSPEPKVGKVTAIAAVLEKRISEPKQLSESVTSVISEPVYSKIDINVQSHNYENVVIGTSSPVNNLFGEAKGCSSIYENVSVVGKTPEPTTSLWNLDTMKGKELTSPLKPLAVTPVDKINTDKYATYKITSKAPSRAQCIKTEELKKLDVKTRILKKTLSNPPSTPVPVVSKVKPTPTKTDKKNIEVKKVRAKLFSDHTRIGGESSPRSQMQKSKSVWEIGNEFMSSNLERTKSSTSISGSPSKIPVIRGHMSPNKFSSTRALFSPTPVDLHNIDQARECAQKKKPNTVRKTAEKGDQIKQTKQKSQLHIKTDAKRSTDKSKKEASDKKTVSPKPTFRDYSDEINALRAKFLQKKVNNKRDLALAVSGRQNENDIKIDLPLTPVKCIVKKLEFQNASESKTDSAHYLNCKVIPPEHKELCVANTTFHNHLSTLVGRQISCTQSRNDAILCSQLVKIPLLKQTEEKISDTHSDCSDDSGHVSNDVHDSDVAFDNMHEMSPLPRSVDEVDCKIYRESKQFGNVLSKCPVRPARRGVIGNEAVSGTRTTGDAPKVEDQIMFRGGVVGELDGRRDAALARVLVRLQARARGLLARRRTHKLRTQHTAARCVQRNVRAFLAVRDWPWWRLLVREELDTLKTKLDKVENERALYKDETEKLQTKNNNGTQITTNGLLSPNSSETLSPPILEATPKKPPKAPLGRPILPMKKSKTLPIHFDEKVPPKVSNGLTNGKKLFVTKPLKEVRTLTLLHGNDNGKIFTSKSPSPSHNRRSTLLSVETGSIAELARRHGSNTLTSRSPSPASYSSIKSSTSNYSTCSSNGSFVPLSRSYSSSSTLCNRSPTPRRMYPQSCDRSDSVDLKELRSKEQAPVVFDANLSFVLGCRKQPVRQRFKPQPAYLEEGTSSNYLSSKIDNFLKRTDHVMDEWRRLGHKDESDLEVYYDGKKRKIGRSKSATNIMIKGFTLFSRGGSRASSVSCRSSRGVSEDRTTVSELDELSEVGGELAEERSAAAVATERADAEAAERLRIERDNRDLQSNNQRLQQASERLELELLHWRSAENGGLEPSDSEGSESEIGVNGEKYKRRFERAHRELQLVRTQLRRQHEDDLEQLVTVKKQLEKKTCRNNLLEKRQRKFDSELQNAQEELKRERTAKERLSRERDQANAEKYALEQSLSEARLELELKEERLLAASRSLEEREGGDEVSALRRAKNELERRTRDQEEELDELAGQIQLLESSKLRLEMLLEQQRKEARLEAAARDDEMEETRANAAKKLKTEAEASEANAALEEANRAKSEASERAITASREAAAARAQFDDAEEEAAELLKKYRASTNAVCAAQAETRAAEARAEAAAEEARVARERANELSARLAAAEAPHAQTQHENERRLELRNKELESSLELEATSRARLESQVSRLRDAHEQLANELAAARAREHQASDDLRKLTRQIRELKEENASVNVKLSEALRAKSAAESAAASAASEASAARDEARLAARRVAALQEAIAGELSSVQDSRDEDSDNDSYSSDESIGTFLANHKLSSSIMPNSRNKTYREERSHIGEFTFTVVKYELFIKTNILSFTKKTLRSLWQLKKCNNSILNKNYLK